MVVSVYGEYGEKNFKEKFLVMISIMYLLMYGLCIGSYHDTLITTSSKVEKW